MPDVAEIKRDLIRGAKDALRDHPKPEQRLITVRAVDLLAVLEGKETPAAERK